MCKGVMKATFSGKMNGEDIANTIGTELVNQIINDGSMLPTTKDVFLPSDEAMATMLGWDNMSDDELLSLMMTSNNDVESEGLTKTVHFGGFIKVGWGCHVSFKIDADKLVKTAECGMVGGAGMGPAPNDDNEEEGEFEFY